MKKMICMIGPNKELNGGISTIINQYSKSYLGGKYNLKIISSYSNRKYEVLKGLLAYIKISTKVDLLHVNMASRGSFYRKSCFVMITPRSCKIVLHIHGGGFINFYNNANTIIKYLIKKTFDKSDYIISISEKFRKDLSEIIGVDSKKIVNIYNGIDEINEIVNFNEKENQVLYMGKLNKDKGVYDFIESIPKVLKECPEVKFIIAGDGEVEKVKEIIDRKKLSYSVKVVGWIEGEQKKKYLRESSIFVMPSHFEAFGISIVEAMQYGLAVVATKVGGIPEIIKSGDNGTLINKGDVEDLSKALVFYINNKKVREVVGKANIIKSRIFSLKNNIESTDKLYEKILI